jgi:hypothetical protein
MLDLIIVQRAIVFKCSGKTFFVKYFLEKTQALSTLNAVGSGNG